MANVIRGRRGGVSSKNFSGVAGTNNATVPVKNYSANFKDYIIDRMDEERAEAEAEMYVDGDDDLLD